MVKRTNVVQVRLDDETFEQLEKVVDAEDRTKTAIVTRALKMYINHSENKME